VEKIWQLIGGPWRRGASHGTTRTMDNPALISVGIIVFPCRIKFLRVAVKRRGAVINMQSYTQTGSI